MALISLHNLSFSYSGPPLLRDITLHLEAGEKVCIIGRNGCGKSTLLHLMNEDLLPAGGSITRGKDLSIRLLPQTVPEAISGTVFDVVARGLGSNGRLIVEIERLNRQVELNSETALLDQINTLRDQIKDATEWDLVHAVNRTVNNCRLTADADVASMSAGMKRRVLMAQTLVCSPDILLLDEPTNHLDIDTIQWLENLLINTETTLVFVTHDRMLVEKVATRIVELDRGEIFNWACDYRKYIQRREQVLHSETRQKDRLDQKLKVEEAWIRRGVKARRTRNEGRVKALKQLRADRRAWRDLTGSVRMRIQEAEKSGRLVIDAQKISFAYDHDLVLNDVSTTIMRQDRIGIMGPNGCGKSTLLKVLLKQLEPQTGSVRHGTRLQIAYFDQLRDQLDPDASLIDSIAGGLREVSIGGKKRHVFSYLKDFLFDPENAEAPVKTLSGGERNRLLLARLFTRSSNLLILDEPTNDLDADTLELLEDQLIDYQGTVIVVSHDRAFLNNVVNATLVFETNHHVQEYAGGYDDWIMQRTKQNTDPATKRSRTSTTKKEAKEGGKSGNSQNPSKSNGKLSYHLVRELERLPDEIAALETEQSEIFTTMSSADFYLRNPSEIKQFEERLRQIEEELETKIDRWAELDDMA